MSVRPARRLGLPALLLCAAGCPFLPALAEEPAEPKAWNLHGQSTFIEQGNLPFREPYRGVNSLAGSGQGRETWTATASLGLRLWRGAEFYVNAEMFQGFGLSETHGLGGFANGEAQKGGNAPPVFYLARYFYRQTFGFGGPTETVDDEFNQLPGIRDVSRLTLTFGKLAVADIFDDNKYARDARTQFLNWSVWAGGAFDYAADQKGYGQGIVLDFNQRDWALRGGYFQLPQFSNAQPFDSALLRRGQYLLELETRHKIASQEGKVRLLAWVSRAFAGSYREALVDPVFDGETSIEATRDTRTQYGFLLGLEQAITSDLGAFARLSWRDGRSEVMSWTDIDRSVSAGLALKGTSWRRENDTVGLAGVINGLSKEHRDYTAAGGLGVTIGDGRLNYRPESILEAYYSVGLPNRASLTFDYQFAVNPAYNADRGPVSILGARLHAQF